MAVTSISELQKAQNEFWADQPTFDSAAPTTDYNTGDPLTPKGEKIKNAMQEQYGKEKGEQVFYATKNAGKISGVDGKDAGDAYPQSVTTHGMTAGTKPPPPPPPPPKPPTSASPKPIMRVHGVPIYGHDNGEGVGGESYIGTKKVGYQIHTVGSDQLPMNDAVTADPPTTVGLPGLTIAEIQAANLKFWSEAQGPGPVEALPVALADGKKEG